MAKTYKIWLELEEHDDDTDDYTNIEGVGIGDEYDNEDKAREAFNQIYSSYQLTS